jgi:hypothetical protein
MKPEPCRAYTLKVMARMPGAGSAAIAVRFREGGNANFRTYDCRVSGTA